MRKILLSLFVLLSLAVPTLAFTDNFNCADNLAGWTIASGSWSVCDGSYYDRLLPGAPNSVLYHDVGSGVRYMTVKFYRAPGGDNYGVYWRNTTPEKGFSINLGGDLSGVGVTLPAFSFGVGVNYTIIVDITASALRFRIYDNAGVLVYDENVVYTLVESDTIRIFSNNAATVTDYITASAVSSSATNSISWGSDNYVKDDSGSYSFTIIDSDWADTFLWVGYDFYIDVYKNGNFVKEIQASSQTGTGYYTFPDTGTYQLKLIKDHILISGSETIANDSVVVRTPGNTYIYINSTVAAGNPTTYQYLWGFTPYVQSYLNGIQIKKLQQDGTYKVYSFQTVNNLAIVANTVYSGTITFPEEGNYVVQLVDLTKGAIGDTVAVKVVFNFVAPTQNITASWINIDQSAYMFGQDIIGDYGVDNTNFSNFQKYIRIQNLDTGNFALDGFSQSKQSNTFNIPIVNTQEREICVFGNVCFQMPQTTFISGNNQIQLVRKNGTDTTILAYRNFTISTTNTAGYGLILSKSKVCQNEQFTAKVIAPAASTLILFDAIKYLELRRWAINGSNITIPIKINSVGNYELNLVGTSGNTSQITQVVEVADCTIPTPTLTSGSTTEQVTAITTLLSSNLFWALIFTVGMMVMVALSTSRKEEK